MCKVTKALFVILGVVGLVTPAVPIMGQGTFLPFFDLSDFISNPIWALDSKSFIFQYATETGVKTTSPSWFQYQVEGKQLIQTNQWPLQPSLTSTQQQIFEVMIDTSGKSTFLFSSPNGRYVVYVSRRWAKIPGFALAIADLQTNEHKILDDISVGASTYDLLYSVKWSKDSKAFAVNVDEPPALCSYYVTNFASSVTAATSIYLDRGLPSGSPIRDAFRVFDISSDGSQLLLAGNFSNNQASIFLWNTLNLPQSQSINGLGNNILAAAFSPNSQYRFRFIGSKGLVEYDMNAGTQTVLDSSISTAWVQKAWFSPNGSRIILQDMGIPKPARLYYVDIRPPNQTPTITATLAFSMFSNSIR